MAFCRKRYEQIITVRGTKAALVYLVKLRIYLFKTKQGVKPT